MNQPETLTAAAAARDIARELAGFLWAAATAP